MDEPYYLRCLVAILVNLVLANLRLYSATKQSVEAMLVLFDFEQSAEEQSVSLTWFTEVQLLL